MTTRKPAHRTIALAVVAASAAMLFVAHIAKDFALARAWYGDPLIALDRIASSASAAMLAPTLAKAAGQLLFALLATAGLALLPLAWLAASLVSRRPLEGLHQFQARDLKIAAVPMMLILLVLESAVFLNGSERFDLAFYGRYPGPLIAASMVVGLALVDRRNARQLSIGIAALIAGCLVLMGIAGPELPYTDYSRFHVVGILPIVDWLSQSSSAGVLWLKLAGTCAAIAALVMALLWRPWYWLAGVCLAVLVTMQVAGPFERGPALSSLVPQSIQATLSRTPCTIHWSTGIGGRLQNHQKYRLQYLFPHCAVLDFRGAGCALPASGMLVAPALRRCAAWQATAIPLPPGLQVVSVAETNPPD